MKTSFQLLQMPFEITGMLYDFCAGSKTLEKSKKLREQLVGLLSKGGFEIRKWSSNTPEALKRIPEALRDTPVQLPEGDVEVKVLGVM